MAITPAKLSRNPWFLDESTTFDICTGQYIVIDRLRWVEASAAGHIVEVTDPDSNIIWRSVASGANYVEEVVLDEDKPVQGRRPGLIVTALESGHLYLYYK